MNELENREFEIVECACEQNAPSGKHEVHDLELGHGDVDFRKDREGGESDIDDTVVDDSDAADELDSPVSNNDESMDKQEHDVEQDNGDLELKKEMGGGESDYDAVADDSDAEGDIESPISDDNEETEIEVSLTDTEVEELISEFLDVESKAAEAQESLEKESLARVEIEVRSELTQTLKGDELEAAVSSEMNTFVEEWEAVLDDLEAESALLLEQLDGAGIDLPTLYKYIESQAPNGCCTEAWKNRAHWVGSQLTDEASDVIQKAENYLQLCRPVKRKHGRLLEEGASGYLGGKLSSDRKEEGAGSLEKDWTKFNELIQSQPGSTEGILFGTKHWASVYLASTPRQAADLGLSLPGVNEVEEIADIEDNSYDPFYADAVKNEGEIDLSEEQKRKFKRVKEEDDLKAMQKLQLRLKRRRCRKRHSQKSYEKECIGERNSGVKTCDIVPSKLIEAGNSLSHIEDGDGSANESRGEKLEQVEIPTDFTKESVPNGSIMAGVDKVTLLHEPDGIVNDKKKSLTVTVESDDEVQDLDKIPPFMFDRDALSSRQDIEVIDILDDDTFPSTSTEVFNYNKAENSKKSHCTACFKMLQAADVRRHPLLDVVVCENCKDKMERKLQHSDPGCSESYCGWCGRFDDLISCKLCKMLFCTSCIKRNFGEDRLSEFQTSGWVCCCCSPHLLHELIRECDEVLHSGYQVSSSSESDSDLNDTEVDVNISNKNFKKRRKRKIRRILDDTELGEETKRKIAMEKNRQDHLKSLQGKSWSKNAMTCNGRILENASVQMLGDVIDGFIVNVAREENEEPVRIPPSISAKLKPHQISGIRFMWQNIIQSIQKVRSGDKGLGCILAHTMGLGKTFQVIAFLYTAMRSVDLGLKNAVIVTPVNVLHNWRQEFSKWRPLELKPLRIYMLEDVARERRPELLAKWKTKGGILLIGYAAFRNLSLGKHVKDKNIALEMCNALQNGPDILVCDEAHMIKNTRADATQALKHVRCQRRIALTGSPLQNNLMEYYCMVDFVREGFLGSSHEFRNRFQNPIENGQHTNSTSEDVKIMNQRSHILYEQLKGFVQRVDMNVVKKDLPPKTVFVVTVKLSPLQRKLYKRFLDVHGFTNLSEKAMRRSCFFAGYQALAQIWNHPGLLQLTKEYKESQRHEDAVENFLVDSGSDDNTERDVMNGEKLKTKNELAYERNGTGLFDEETDWWKDLLKTKIYKEVDYSGKIVLLLDILIMSADVGDKALVFSQSLATLDLIELFLSKLPRKEREGKFWKQGKDWYRLDGSTEGSIRQKIVERFNEPNNRRVKCTLISTRAGSLGINLHAANRVVLVDGSWNPTYDLQAIYRVWRYGQRKPVYAYRLMAHGTMEEKIYKRQVTKEGMAARVVDRQQIHRTISKEEMLHLFDFGEDDHLDTTLDQNSISGLSSEFGGSSLLKKCLPLSQGNCSDKFMETLVSRHYPRWIANYHEHETLLQENEEEKLSKEEQDMAWEVFKRTVEWEEVQRTSFEPSLPEPKPLSNVSRLTKHIIRNHTVERKCTSLSHLLTLRSQGTRTGSSTICGECSKEISWEGLRKNNKAR